VSLTPVPSAAGGGVSPLAGPSLTWQLVSGVATVAAGAVSASDDGARVAFCANDAYVVDTDGMSATRASVSPIGDAANAQVGHTALSGDGAVVAFATSATNTVLSDVNGETDVFARDLVTNTTGLVSLTNGGAQADLWSIFPDVSDTGRYVSFQSNADNLSSFDNNDMSNLYVRDRIAGTTTLVNGYRDGNSWDIELADSGTTGVFVTAATNFPGVTDLNGQLDVVVWGGGW
jgi:Tol biopolymer transport system component